MQAAVSLASSFHAVNLARSSTSYATPPTSAAATTASALSALVAASQEGRLDEVKRLIATGSNLEEKDGVSSV